jgi:hypothetical protein
VHVDYELTFVRFYKIQESRPWREHDDFEIIIKRRNGERILVIGFVHANLNDTKARLGIA